MSVAMINQPSLSRTEWKAVSIALSDAETYSCVPAQRGVIASKISNVFHLLTGIERKRPLADPKLETLREFVCATRRTRKAPEQLVPRLIDQGFNYAQVEALALLAA
jgi:hypothetical protein